MPSWNPDLYLQFADERTQPSRDLAARVPLAGAESILDIGCGPGNSTAVIAARYPNSKQVLGVDSSPAMVKAAAGDYPQYEFRQCDVTGDISPLGSFDVVFSNACLQWLPNHEELLPRLMACVAKGGALAVQIPVNQRSPIQQIAVSLSQNEKYSAYIKPREIFTRLTPAQYYDILAPLSQTVQMWQTTYHHVLENHEAIVEWYRGTGLRPYLDVLPPALTTEFLADALAGVQEEYPTAANGKVLFPFARLFFIATK